MEIQKEDWKQRFVSHKSILLVQQIERMFHGTILKRCFVNNSVTMVMNVEYNSSNLHWRLRFAPSFSVSTCVKPREIPASVFENYRLIGDLIGRLRSSDSSEQKDHFMIACNSPACVSI